MAKIGETDSRWIVSRRSDGKNVANWHWTERDIFPWCQEQFEKIFKSVKIPSDKAELSINGVDTIKGEMIVCNRKGKTLYVFDIAAKLKWEGNMKVGDDTVKGKGLIIIDDIANTEDKWKVNIRIEDETAKNRELKEEVKNKINPMLDGMINEILENMKAITSPQEPVGTGEVIMPPKPVLVNSTKTADSTQDTSSQNSATSSGSSIKTRSFKQTVSFNISVNAIYETLVDQQRVCAFTGGPAKIENKSGGEFILYDGAVQGKQEELVPNKKIVQKWRFNSWPENHYSQVTLDFEESSGRTTITLTQTGVPSSDLERTRDGWETYFWRRIRGLFGWEYKIKEKD